MWLVERKIFSPWHSVNPSVSHLCVSEMLNHDDDTMASGTNAHDITCPEKYLFLFNPLLHTHATRVYWDTGRVGVPICISMPARVDLLHSDDLTFCLSRWKLARIGWSPSKSFLQWRWSCKLGKGGTIDSKLILDAVLLVWIWRNIGRGLLLPA